jgi:hypothetical protein
MTTVASMTSNEFRLEVSDFLRDMRKLLDDLAEALEDTDNLAIEDITVAILERTDSFSATIGMLGNDGDVA